MKSNGVMSRRAFSARIKAGETNALNMSSLTARQENIQLHHLGGQVTLDISGIPTSSCLPHLNPQRTQLDISRTRSRKLESQ